MASYHGKWQDVMVFPKHGSPDSALLEKPASPLDAEFHHSMLNLTTRIHFVACRAIAMLF
jgi:hypothetical protein